MDNNSGLQGIAIVLCRVEGSMNVGASCRAMKAMGITRLVLADCPPHDEVLVKTHALQAFDVYEAAEYHTSLRDALAGFSLAAGFTRRTGHKRKENLPVESFAGSLSERVGTAIALVFGNERDGLSDAELSLCDEAVGIASSSLFPSLNLSHAVQIACWEVRKSLCRNFFAEGRTPASRAATEHAVLQIMESLQTAGFYKIAGRPEAETFLRSMANRASLSETELERFASFFIKMGALYTSQA